jgi:hypothetical protein
MGIDSSAMLLDLQIRPHRISTGKVITDIVAT